MKRRKKREEEKRRETKRHAYLLLRDSFGNTLGPLSQLRQLFNGIRLVEQFPTDSFELLTRLQKVHAINMRLQT